MFPDFAFMWLVEEAKKNMPLELDFLNEGRNAEKVADMLRQFNFLKVCESVSSCGIGKKTTKPCKYYFLLIVFGCTAAIGLFKICDLNVLNDFRLINHNDLAARLTCS